jgi:hypothetical protein
MHPPVEADRRRRPAQGSARRNILVAGRDDNGARVERLLAGLDDVSGAVGRQACNLGSRAYRALGGQPSSRCTTSAPTANALGTCPPSI